MDRPWKTVNVSMEVLRELATRYPDVSFDAALRLELKMEQRVRKGSALSKYVWHEIKPE